MTPLPQIVSRNQLQKSNLRSIPAEIVTSGAPRTWYTCPTGKVAKLKGSCVCTDTGAAAVVDLMNNGVSIAEWQASGGGVDPNVPQDLAEGTLFRFDITLAAGDIVNTEQDSGTNATILFEAQVEEFPV